MNTFYDIPLFHFKLQFGLKDFVVANTEVLEFDLCFYNFSFNSSDTIFSPSEQVNEPPEQVIANI